MIEVDCIQGTPEWWQAKLGVPSASNFKKIIQPKRMKASGSQIKYIAELLGNITDPSANYFTSQGGPVNASVEYGRVTEAKARRWYEMKHGCTVRQVGFCKTDDGRFGASPDGLVDPEGGLEIRCPDRDTHMLCLMTGEIPLTKIPQIHGGLIVTGRKWWDYVDYCENTDTFEKRVYPNEYTMALRVQLELFDKSYQAEKKRLNIGQQDQDMETQEAIAEAAKWTEMLVQIEFDVHEGKIDEQEAVEAVNRKLPELKKMESASKRKVYHTLKAWIEARPVKWHLDTVNLVYRLQESGGF